MPTVESQGVNFTPSNHLYVDPSILVFSVLHFNIFIYTVSFCITRSYFHMLFSNSTSLLTNMCQKYRLIRSARQRSNFHKTTSHFWWVQSWNLARLYCRHSGLLSHNARDRKQLYPISIVVLIFPSSQYYLDRKL